MEKNVQPPPKTNPDILIDKEKCKRIIRTQQLTFIPPISAKVIISFIFCEFFLSNAALNKIDTPYIKISICFIVFMFFYTYYLSVSVSPEQTNINKYFNKSTKEIINLNLFYWKDCQFCNSKKFIRSSHCRTCQQCMLFRDHHCPYTANCIGFKNIQYFLNFLFWGIYAIVYYNISCINVKIY